MKEITKKFINFVNKYGVDGELSTFEICANEGVELAGSTIDKISVCGDNVSFYYNENTGDHDTINAFNKKDLEDFYKGLRESFINEYEMDKIEPIVESILHRIFNTTDALIITMRIIKKVVQYIYETTDEEYNNDDIEFAVQRVLKERIYNRDED